MHIRSLVPGDIPAAAALLRHAAFTVNSSNHAVPFYASLGFVPTAPMQAGIVRYQPMRLVLGSGALVDPA